MEPNEEPTDLERPNLGDSNDTHVFVKTGNKRKFWIILISIILGRADCSNLSKGF